MSKPRRENVTFEEYLKFIGADIKENCTEWEYARFGIKGPTRGEKIFIIYQNKRGNFSFSDHFCELVYKDFKGGIQWWQRYLGKKESDIGTKIKELKTKKEILANGKYEVNKIFLPLMYHWELIEYLSKEFGWLYKTKDLRTIEDCRDAYRIIKQYRRIWLKEEV